MLHCVRVTLSNIDININITSMSLKMRLLPTSGKGVGCTEPVPYDNKEAVSIEQPFFSLF